MLFPNVGGPRFAKDDRIATLGGPPASLQAAGPPGISSRDSLPALNAMPGVQVLHPVQRVRSRRAFVCRRRSQGHPRPPQLAGQAFSWHKGSPSTRCCVGGAPGVEGVCSLRLCKGRQSAERSSRRRVGCHLSVSVSCRTRSRRPTVFRPLPENSDKGKDFKIWGVVRRTLPYSAPVFGKSMAQTPGQALFAGNKAVFNASFCFRLRRKAVYQRSGAPGQPSGGRAAGKA